MFSTFQRQMWEIGANGEQHNHWLLENAPLEPFTVHRFCQFTTTWLSHIRFFERDLKRDVSKLTSREDALYEPSPLSHMN